MFTNILYYFPLQSPRYRRDTIRIVKSKHLYSKIFRELSHRRETRIDISNESAPEPPAERVTKGMIYAK